MGSSNFLNGSKSIYMEMSSLRWFQYPFPYSLHQISNTQTETMNSHINYNIKTLFPELAWPEFPMIIIFQFDFEFENSFREWNSLLFV